MNSIFLIINILLLLHKSQSIHVSSSNSFENDNIDSEDDLFNHNFNANIYLPEYQNKFSRINELNDTNFNFMKIKNNRSVVLVPDNIIAKNEKLLEIENVAKLINKIENNNDTSTSKKIIKNKKEIYPDDYSFYGSTNILSSDYNYKYIKKNALIYDKGTSSIKDIISTEPEEIKLEYEICKPKPILFKIFNKNADENLIIKDIKTDLYQVKIFPYISNKKNSDNDIITENLIPNIDSYLEHAIYPRTIFVFQLIFLLDFKTRIKGTLYIEFNDKKVLLIPIQIIGYRNIYSIEPIYRLNFQTKKLFEEKIQITNPTSKTVYIKEIIHSFERIKVFWANGEIFKSHNNSLENSSIEIEPITEKKNILILRYYAKNVETKYGVIHIRTDEHILVIPILINFVNSPIETEPKLLNFGICDITPKSRDNFMRIIPFKLINNGKEYIKIGKVYINYDELFLQFHQNFGGNNITIKPNEKINFGYFIFNANVEYKNNQKSNNILKNLKKIYIETNSTLTPLIEIYYSYIPYMNNELQEVTGNIQKKPMNKEIFSFYLNVKFKKGIKLRTYNSYLPGENVTIRDRYMIAKVKNPSNEYQSTNSKILIEIDRISELKSLHYFYLPLLLNDMQYTLIPIQIDNDDLGKIYCGDEDKAKSLSICKKNLKPENEINTIKNTSKKIKPFIIDFGQVPQGVIKKQYIYLINSNESPIKIDDIIINEPFIYFFIDFESYEYFGNKEESFDISYPQKGELIEKLKEKYYNSGNNESISFTVYPNTAVKLSINLFSKKMNSDKTIKNEIVFKYSENYRFILSLNASVLKGSLYLSEKSYSYEPAFSGLYQNKIIEAENNYNFPINILSVTSTDKRIIHKLLIDKIYPNEKVSLLNVLFDPSKYFEFRKGYELNMSNILTYKELYLWKIEDKYFDTLEVTDQTSIKANLSIKTTLNTEYINFKGLLIKPNLVKKEKINFGLNQIGKPAGIFIEGINPSDKILLIKLLLADDYYYNVHWNNMFNKNDKLLLSKNSDLIIFSCNFILKINSTNVIKYEHVIVPEKIDPIELRKGSFDKKELIRLLYKYGNENVKNYLYKSENILCKYDKKKQTDILFNKNNEYNYAISQIYSKEFNEEISSIKNMTFKDIDENTQYKYVEKKSFIYTIISYLFNLYLKYIMNMFIYSNINIVENTQSFFIPKNIQNKIYQIPPHKTFSIGPIIFKPNKTGIIRGTLFLKNNLTILYPLKLEGEGGGGIIRFFDYYRGINKKRCKIYNERNLLIEIDEEIYETEIKNSGNKFNRTISLMNVGNLPLVIKNVTLDNSNDCVSDNLRIIQCKEISISPKEMIDIDLEIRPNYRTSALNKIIYFNTEYQTFYLNVIILLTNEFYEKKNFLWIYFKCFIVVFTIVSVMMYSITKILNLIQKQRREICDKESIKEEILEEKEDKEKMVIKEKEEINLNNKKNINNNKQNKTSKKKKRKRSIQKEEIDIINNKKENIGNDNNVNENKVEKNIEIINKEEDNVVIKKDDRNVKEDIKEEVKEDKKEIREQEIKEDIKEDKNIILNSSKNKKRKVKNSVSSKKSENEKNIHKNKNEKNEESISEDKKEKEKKKSTESNRYNNENEIYENYNNNYSYNKNYQNRYRKGKKDINKKYYYNNYPGNRKYNNSYYNNYYENNNISNNNNFNNNYNYNNNYNNNYTNNYNTNYNNNYNNNYQQQKKNVTKITIKEKNVKNLKELFESEQNKEKKELENNSKNKVKSNKKEKLKNNDKNDNDNISKTSKNKDNNSNVFEKDSFEKETPKDIFDYNFPINKKISQEKKTEEMNPTFLSDEKINNAFDFEQDLIKSLKKENKNNKEEIPKDDLDLDFNNSDQFNFNCFFFDKNQSQEEEGEYTGNYEDYRYKSIIDNLNSEYHFSTDEQKSRLDSLNMSGNAISNSKNEYDVKKEEDENNENDEFLNNKNKFGYNFNFMNFDNNNNY